MGIAKIVKNGERLVWDGKHDIEVEGLPFCCAIMEITGIQDVNDAFTVLVTLADMDSGIGPVVIYSTTNNHTIGDRLAAFIKKEKLGNVICAEGVKNHNDPANNTVYVYTWTVNKPNWYKFADRIETLLDNE